MVIVQDTYEGDKIEKGKKTELRIEMNNFGPIISGTIDIKPLTIFVGPNDSGKSYIAMLIYSIFKSYADLPIRTARFLPRKLHRFRASEYLESSFLEKELSEIGSNVGMMKEGEELEIPLWKIVQKIFEIIYEERLSSEVVRSYACLLRELIRVGEKSFSLRIEHSAHSVDLEYSKNKLKLGKFPQSTIKAKIKMAEMGGSIFETRMKGNELFIEVDSEYMKKNKEMVLSNLNLILLDLCLENFPKEIAVPCYYLPAARSGILQGHRALAAKIVRNAPLIGIEKIEIPEFSGVIADFISSILELPEQKGPFYTLARECERELIKGEIVVKKLDDYRYPEIRYKFQKTEIPLHRASSTVSELAPLFLYLKYLIEPGCVLIIEEPEAHLHPRNQRILAKYLVRLLRKGVYLVITTHSDFLLDQLSNFIMLSKVTPEKKVSKYGYSEEDYLKVDEVSAYVFRYDATTGGNTISEVEITEEEGISQEEHMRVIDALYEETIRLRRDLGNE